MFASWFLRYPNILSSLLFVLLLSIESYRVNPPVIPEFLSMQLPVIINSSMQPITENDQGIGSLDKMVWRRCFLT
jgi:hypothetical protein